MAVKIRLKRMGKRKQPTYRVVVSDSRKARAGDYIEAIGFYDPRQDPSIVEIENDRAVDWLGKGAQPTEAARKLLEISGAWTEFKIARGEVHTVGAGSPAAPAEPTPVEPTPADAEADLEPGDDTEAEVEPQPAATAPATEDPQPADAEPEDDSETPSADADEDE